MHRRRRSSPLDVLGPLTGIIGGGAAPSGGGGG